MGLPNLRLLTLALGLLCGAAHSATASHHYTFRQLESLAERVGLEFWINAPDSPAPIFLLAPAPKAGTFRPADNESFEISELIGRSTKNPYYKVKFRSGKIAYLRPETFHEEFNARIVTSDPLAEQKRQAEQAAENEKHRLAWINVQPWPPAVKEAAIKKQPTPGLNSGEIKQVMGPPRRIVESGGLVSPRGPTQVHEERWYYADGTVLWFRNDILSRVDRPAAQP